MPSKDRPQVERHPPKKGVGWLYNVQMRQVCRFPNDMPIAHAQWVEVETQSVSGQGHPVVRRMLRHTAIEAWQTMRKSLAYPNAYEGTWITEGKNHQNSHDASSNQHNRPDFLFRTHSKK